MLIHDLIKSGFIKSAYSELAEAASKLELIHTSYAIDIKNLHQLRRFDTSFYSKKFTDISKYTRLDLELEKIDKSKFTHHDVYIYDTVAGTFLITPNEIAANISLSKSYYDHGYIPVYTCIYTTFFKKIKYYVMWYITDHAFVAPSLN